LSGGVDFDLPDAADAATRDRVVEQWQAWYAEEARDGFRQRLRATAHRDRLSRLKDMVESPNVHERWAAAKYLSSRSTRMWEHLLTLIGDADAGVRRTVKPALVEIAEGQDFGPPEDASDEQVAAAVARWQSWWEERKLQDRLRLAEQMCEINPEAAARRLDAIIREHPDSETAREAAVLRERLRWKPPEPTADAPEQTQADETEEPAATDQPVTDEDQQAAAKMLEFAVRFLSRDTEAFEQRLRELIQRYPGTQAAQEAEKYLEKKAREGAGASKSQIPTTKPEPNSES
jgi:hypothetical protein